MMKLPIVFAAAVALSTCISAQEQCEVCPGGINVDGGTETENGNTCGTIQSDAARFDTDDPICDRIKGFEELCCGGNAVETTVANVVESTETAAVTTEAAEATETPVAVTETPEADTSCSVCPNGITVAADTPTEGKNVCGGIQAAAAQFDADDGICERIKSFESTCCPEVPPTTVPAIVTTAAAVAESTAAAVEGSTVAGQSTEAAVTTAAAAAGSTGAPVTTEAAVATTAAAVGSTVAPLTTEAAVATTAAAAVSTVAAVTTALPGSSCVVCSGGITAPSTLETVPGKTCADLLPDAARQEAGDGICELIQQSEETCCPTGGFIACSVCAGGLTVSGATLVEGDITCDDVIGDAPTIPESSDVCTEKKGYEDTCCPAIITPTTTVAATEVATSTAAAASTVASTVASTSSTVSATEASTTASTAAADVSMTNSTITEPTPAVEPKSPTGSEEESSISGFQALYDSSTGFSVSANPRYAFASIVIVGVYTMFS